MAASTAHILTRPALCGMAQRAGMLLLALPLTMAPGPSGAPVQAGAWPQPVGETQIIARLAHSDAPDAFGPTGTRIKPGRFEKTELEIYAEHGWRKSVTLLAKPSFQHVRAGSDARHGLASVEAGARARLFRFETGSVLSAQASLTLPGGKYHRESPLITSGHADLDARLLFGEPTGLFLLPGYTDLQIAYRHRGGPPADELRADLTYGVDLSERWAVSLQSQTVATIGRVRAPYTHYRSQKLQGALRFALGAGRHVELGALRTLSGAATARETGAFISFWVRF